MSATTQPLPAAAAATETADQALVRAQAAAQAKRPHEAMGICNDVLTANPEHPAAIALLGIVAAMAGDPERGIVLLRRAISLRPGNGTWHAHLSSLCRQTYKIAEALTAGQESIRLDPGNAEHLVNLSLIFSDADDRERLVAIPGTLPEPSRRPPGCRFAPRCSKVIAACREHLATFKLPREVEFIDALPKLPNGKILRRVLRDKVRSAR